MAFFKYHEFIAEANINSVIDRIGDKDEVRINDMDEYILHFIENGAKRLAGGSSAEVLEYKEGIIKIYAPINDPAMTRYLAFCLANKSNPFVPKIDKILKTWAIEENRWIFAIFMENLSPSKKDFANELDGYLTKELSELSFSAKIDNQFFSGMKEIILKNTKPANEKPLNDVINYLRGGISKFKYRVDFGPQNWMMRGSQLVLIDPFWPDME